MCLGEGMTTIDVGDNPGQSRYEVRLDGDLVGFAEYERSGSLVTFTHTEVSPLVGGRGVGSALVRGALDDVRAAGDLRVVPRCPFVRGWIASHEDYADLVAPERTVRD